MVSISLFGLPGTGTSTVGKLYSKKYHLEFISSGNLFRDEAKKRNLSVLELNEIAEKDSKIDKNLDELIRKIGIEKKGIIVDSRLAWHFIPNSIKIKLTATDITRCNRIQIREGNLLSEILSQTKKREDLEKQRYKQIYQIEDYSDDFNFDYVINTNNLTPEKIIKLIKFYVDDGLKLSK